MDSVSGPLLIISRNTLLRIEDSPRSAGVFRQLANLSRKGVYVLLTAPEPDHWLPTRGSVDNALSEQGRLQEAIHECGGDLDGVYYVPKSRFTQDRNREGALRDILARYGVSAQQAVLISSSKPFLRSAKRLGVPTHAVAKGEEGIDSLHEALDSVIK